MQSLWKFSSRVLLATFTLPCGGVGVNLGQCISEIYQWSLAIVGIVAFVQIVWAGWIYLTAFGNTSKTGEARSKITNAILGIILLFSSYLILRTINPALVGGEVNLPKIIKEDKIVDPVGNPLTKIENFDVTPKSADLSDKTELLFTLRISASSGNFEKMCKAMGSDSSPTQVRPRYSVYFLDSPNAAKPGQVVRRDWAGSKSDFGESGKTLPFDFREKVSEITPNFANGNNSGRFYATFDCFDGGRSPILNESAPVIVRVAP